MKDDNTLHKVIAQLDLDGLTVIMMDNHDYPFKIMDFSGLNESVNLTLAEIDAIHKFAHEQAEKGDEK